MQGLVHTLGSLVPIFLNIDSCPPPLAHAPSMISPLKVVSFAAAKPDVSNIHAPILIISFFIFLSLGLNYFWKHSLSLSACRRKGFVGMVGARVAPKLLRFRGF